MSTCYKLKLIYFSYDSNFKKKLRPRIKARIRKNKQILDQNIGNFFDWIKGAELVELKKCNTEEDPVRPHLINDFKRFWS